MPAELTFAPETSYISVRNASITVAEGEPVDEEYSRGWDTNEFVLSSRVPVGRTASESLTVANPTAFFVHVLHETLLASGIAVSGRPVDIDELSILPMDEDLNHIFSHFSPPLSEIVVPLNKRSHNLYADQVLRAIAVAKAPEEGEPAAGTAALAIERARLNTFAAAGIDTMRIQLVDGSGLARQNLITSTMTTSLLRYMWNHPDQATREAFIDSLPIGGVDGTLSSRMRDTAAQGAVRAKTGTMSNVSALAGYVDAANGRTYAFSIMANNYTESSRRVRLIQDRIMEVLAR